MALQWSSFPLCCGASVLTNFHNQDSMIRSELAPRVPLKEKEVFDKDPIDWYYTYGGGKSSIDALERAIKTYEAYLKNSELHASYKAQYELAIKTNRERLTRLLYERPHPYKGHGTVESIEADLITKLEHGYSGTGVYFAILNQAEQDSVGHLLPKHGFKLVGNNFNNINHTRSRLHVYMYKAHSWDDSSAEFIIP